MKYYESPTMAKINEIVFGKDLKQHGTFTMSQLEDLLQKSDFNDFQSVLEIGCGAGFIADYISNKTSARFLCIDIDDDVIKFASEQHKANKKLVFITFDVRKIKDLNQKFTKILAFDSLYFLAEIDPNDFQNSLDKYLLAVKNTIQNLYDVLENNGELILTWSELPFFKPERKAPECTQIGICFGELGYKYRAIDFTKQEEEFWKSYKETLHTYKNDFISEGSNELYDMSIQEATFFCEGVSHNRLYRNLFIIKKG